MRIDRTSGIPPHELPDRVPSPGAKPTGETPDGRPIPDDPQIRHLHEKYTPQAGTVDAVNLQAVADARKLLESGQLASPEAVERAAESILALGF